MISQNTGFSRDFPSFANKLSRADLADHASLFACIGIVATVLFGPTAGSRDRLPGSPLYSVRPELNTSKWQPTTQWNATGAAVAAATRKTVETGVGCDKYVRFFISSPSYLVIGSNHECRPQVRGVLAR